MSASFRDLSRHVEALPTPDFDTAALIRQGEAKVRRRQAATWIAAAVAVSLVGFGAATLGRGDDRSAPPAKQDRKTDVITASPVRKVTYGGGYWPTTTIHYGNRTLDVPEALSVSTAATQVVHMDVTDDGVVFTIAHLGGAGRGIWFTDGVSVHRIGRIRGYLGIRASAAVVSGTSGSRVAWLDESAPIGDELVVYDTRADREVKRVAVPDCTEFRTSTCELDGLIGEDHVYFVRGDIMHHHPDVLMRLSVSTGTLERVTTGELAADRARAPRGLILGDSPEAGVVSDGYGTVFTARGARLVPMLEGRATGDPTTVPTVAFDTATRQRVRFRLPVGYDGAEELTAFEWLDDDRLALMNAANSWDQTTADIVVCRVSTGECTVVDPATPGDKVRVVPHLPLPG